MGIYHTVRYVLLAALVLTAAAANAREIHVARSGNDQNAGTADAPYLTINKAAQEALPGDTVVIHEGTYREWVKPARGGDSDARRITYRAAERGKAVLKGSERITTWYRPASNAEARESRLWKVVLPDTLFGDYNPFKLNVYGGWLNYGEWHHRGAVYLDGEALVERQSLDEVRATPRTWFTASLEGKTVIWANFGDADPNKALTEINVRQCVFFPEKTGLGFLTLDGLVVRHSAENWAPPGSHQKGAIGTNWGKAWIIQNCELTDAKCVGISLGHVPGIPYRNADIRAFGHHVVRHNVIRRCGESGINGQGGAVGSLIEGNLIEEINIGRQFGGWETAAVKFHAAVDVTIRNNVIRRVQGLRSGGAFGIWLDWEAQGARISGNLISDTEGPCVYLEVNHGPILVDNNVFLGGGILQQSEGGVFVHNLFFDCPIQFRTRDDRVTPFYKPHTTQVAGTKSIDARDDRWFNNLFFGKGLDPMPEAPGYKADFNVFLGGARKGRYDQHSVVDATDPRLSRRDSQAGTEITLTLPAAVFDADYPLITHEFIGKVPLVKQGIESPDGKPITIDTDLFGATRKAGRQVPGPFAGLKPGANTLRLLRR
ncbi:MAG: right-handed parallel beta-helix repeat-containing protein [Thermoguttaceae bacterium]